MNRNQANFCHNPTRKINLKFSVFDRHRSKEGFRRIRIFSYFVAIVATSGCDTNQEDTSNTGEASAAEVLPTTAHGTGIDTGNAETGEGSNSGTTTPNMASSSTMSDASSDADSTTGPSETGGSSTTSEGTESSSETSSSDTLDTSGSEGDPPEDCPPHPDFYCEVDYDCTTTENKTPWICGALNSPLDIYGCMRPTCLSHQDCATGQKCFSDFLCNEDGCTRSNMDCRDDRSPEDAGICDCSGADDCSGDYGWCVPEAIYDCPLEQRKQ